MDAESLKPAKTTRPQGFAGYISEEARLRAEKQAAEDRELLESLEAAKASGAKAALVHPSANEALERLLNPEMQTVEIRPPSRAERRAIGRRPHHKAYTQPKDAAARRRNRRRVARRSTALNRR